MRAIAERGFDLLPLHGGIGDVARNTQVDVDLRAKAFAYAFRRKCSVIDVGRDRNATGGNPFANEFGAAVLLLGNNPHLRRDFAATRGIELRHSAPFVGITHIRFKGRGVSAPPLSRAGGNALAVRFRFRLPCM